MLHPSLAERAELSLPARPVTPAFRPSFGPLVLAAGQGWKAEGRRRPIAAARRAGARGGAALFLSCEQLRARPLLRVPIQLSPCNTIVHATIPREAVEQPPGCRTNTTRYDSVERQYHVTTTKGSRHRFPYRNLHPPSVLGFRLTLQGCLQVQKPKNSKTHNFTK